MQNSIVVHVKSGIAGLKDWLYELHCVSSLESWVLFESVQSKDDMFPKLYYKDRFLIVIRVFNRKRP